MKRGKWLLAMYPPEMEAETRQRQRRGQTGMQDAEMEIGMQEKARRDRTGREDGETDEQERDSPLSVVPELSSAQDNLGKATSLPSSAAAPPCTAERPRVERERGRGTAYGPP